MKARLELLVFAGALISKAYLRLTAGSKSMLKDAGKIAGMRSTYTSESAGEAIDLIHGEVHFWLTI